MPVRIARQALESVGAIAVPSQIPLRGRKIIRRPHPRSSSFSSRSSRSSCQPAISLCWGCSTYLHTSASSRSFPFRRRCFVPRNRFGDLFIRSLGFFGCFFPRLPHVRDYDIFPTLPPLLPPSSSVYTAFGTSSVCVVACAFDL